MSYGNGMNNDVEVFDKDVESIRLILKQISEESNSQASLIAAVTLLMEQMKSNDVELVSLKTSDGNFEVYTIPVSH